MTTERVPGLPLYRLELPTPFPVGPVNVYLVTEPEPVLIDTGVNTRETVALLEAMLERAGLRIESLRKIVVTHGHLDHYGLARELARRSGAPVYAPSLDEPHFGHREKLDAFYRAMMEQAGIPAPVIRQIGEQVAGFRRLAAPLEEYRPIEELGILRCGALEFQQLATPGHTKGSISFFAPAQRLMLSADTVIKHITPNPMLDHDGSAPRERFPALGVYLKSLDRIRALNPACIYTGHGQRVDSYAPHHDRVLELHHERQDAIRRCLRERPCSVYQICAILFPDPQAHNSFLGISEVYAHVDLLEDAGEVQKRFLEGVAFYSMV